MKHNTLSWTDTKSGQVYQINESYLKFYKKDLSGIKFKKFLGPSRIFNYIKDFHANLCATKKFTMSESFDMLEDRCMSFRSALQEHEKHLVVISESQTNVLTTAQISDKFAEWCHALLPSSLADLTLGQVGESNPKYQNMKIVDWVVPVDDSETSPAVTFHVPLYAKSQLAADNFLKELTAKMHIAGYDFSTQQAERPFTQPFKEPIVILSMQFEAIESSLHADFSTTQFLYHVSPSRNYKSIKAHGIVPMSGSSQFKYAPRVYLFNRTSMIDVIEYGRWKTVDEFVEDSPDLMFCIWKVDMKKLQELPEFKNGSMKFFKDAMSTNDPDDKPDDTAVFTCSKIPQSVIDNMVLVFKVDIDQQAGFMHKVIDKSKTHDIHDLLRQL